MGTTPVCSECGKDLDIQELSELESGICTECQETGVCRIRPNKTEISLSPIEIMTTPGAELKDDMNKRRYEEI